MTEKSVLYEVAAQALLCLVTRPTPAHARAAVDALAVYLDYVTAPPAPPPSPPAPAPTSHASKIVLGPETAGAAPASTATTASAASITLSRIRAVVDGDSTDPADWYRMILQIRDLIGVTR